MPKFIEGVTDASARSLSIYNEIKSRIDWMINTEFISYIW
jgi:hypothetical protein